ncbi:hypothetical protein ACTFQ7_26965 [Bacillus cereus group sp. MYBK226-2]|uniref:hypothetical protein n=1 Tax=Bacillus cereus group sp. MYBK226-2 TaxID=3450655 RepID=UPI003F7ACA0E
MESAINNILRSLNYFYWRNIKEVVNENKKLKTTIPSFLLNPDKINIYIGKEHIGIEYLESDDSKDLSRENIRVRCLDYSTADNFIEEIIGIKFDAGGMQIPLDGVIEDLYVATIEATEILTDNNWNFLAQEMMFMLNVSGVSLGGEFNRIRNSFFYEKNGDGLKVRNIKWLDIFPIEWKDSDSDDVEAELIVKFPDLPTLAIEDAHYTLPEKLYFQYDKLKILNRFIELYNTEGISETEITRFLSNPSNQFILKMAFFGDSIYAEKECNWVGNEDKPAIRPDFFVSGTNGFADIVEFKMPKLKTNKAIVGKENRESFSAEIYSYISQTRVYRDYFEDPRNRELVKEIYGLQVYYPKRFLVIGRRWMFSPEVWRAIENDHSNLTIRTYDDIVDTVMGHLMN